MRLDAVINQLSAAIQLVCVSTSHLLLQPKMMLLVVLVAIAALLDPTVCQVTPSTVFVDTLRSFNGVPTDPECTSGGAFDTSPVANDNFACNVPASRLTDGVLGESSPVNFSRFSAWNRTTDMPRVFFQFPSASNFYISQIDLYYYKSAALRVGLPDVRIAVINIASIPQSSYLPVPYTIVSNQSILESDNQTVKISLVSTLDQELNAYPNNRFVRLSFDFSSSDTLDWLLLSEVMMFNDTAVPPPPQPPITFTQDQVTVVHHNATDLVSSERLTCSVINEAAFEWSWTGPNGATISSNVFVADLTRTSALQISSLSLSDAGNYNCTAAFLTAGVIPIGSKNTSTISLQLEGLVTPSDPVTTNSTSNATLSCEFSGYLPRNPTFSWENSQGLMISDTNKFTIQSSVDTDQTILIIRSVVQTDSGNYTCRMRGDNNAELSGVAQLTVNSITSHTTVLPTSSTSSVFINSTATVPIFSTTPVTINSTAVPSTTPISIDNTVTVPFSNTTPTLDSTATLPILSTAPAFIESTVTVPISSTTSASIDSTVVIPFSSTTPVSIDNTATLPISSTVPTPIDSTATVPTSSSTPVSIDSTATVATVVVIVVVALLIAILLILSVVSVVLCVLYRNKTSYMLATSSVLYKAQPTQEKDTVL